MNAVMASVLALLFVLDMQSAVGTVVGVCVMLACAYSGSVRCIPIGILYFGIAAGGCVTCYYLVQLLYFLQIPSQEACRITMVVWLLLSAVSVAVALNRRKESVTNERLKALIEKERV